MTKTSPESVVAEVGPAAEASGERGQTMRQNRDLATFPSENPNPVLRVAAEGAVLYANEAARALDGLLEGADGGVLCGALARAVSAAFRSAECGEAELVRADRVYVFALTPVAGYSYVNLYGRDVTDERRANAEARNLAKFPSENPNPILRVVGDDGAVLYANEAARDLAGLLGDADALTESLVMAVFEADRAGEIRTVEF